MAGLGDLRQSLFDEADWDPGASPEAVRQVNGFINSAVKQISLDAPFLFNEEEVRLRLQPTVEPTLTTDRLYVPTDTTPANTPKNPWTLITGIDRATTDAVVWKNDRTWDGRWIELYDDTTGDVVHRSKIQAVGYFTSLSAVDLVAITLTTPIDYSTHGNGPFNYKVFTSEYWLRDDIIDVRNVKVLSDASRSPIRIVGQAEAEDLALPGLDSKTSPGTPVYMYRRGTFSMKGPNTAPAPSLGDDTVVAERWQGPEPPGKFSYRITFTWGKRSAEYQNSGVGWWADGMTPWDASGPGHSSDSKAWSEDRYKEPLWESAPSPVSVDVTVPAPATTSTNVGAVKLLLPNIEYQLGYLLAGTTSAATAFQRGNTGLSGWHVRVYRRRWTENFVNYTGFGNNQLGQSIDTLQKLDIDDSYYLLAEVAIDDINEGVFWDSGRILPDYRRRLRSVHGYQGVQFYPWPDVDYDLALRVLRSPDLMTSDQDVPSIHPAAADLIVKKAATFLYKKLNRPGDKRDAESDYTDRLRTLRKRFGDLRPEGRPMYRRSARFGPSRRRRLLWNRIGEDT